MTKMPDTTSGPDRPSRRNFLAAMGATVATLNTAACIRKPREKILPFARRPESLVPGRPEYYATAFSVGERVLGVLACSTDGRPTKIEGNPNHPVSRGRTDAWAQASVLELYDPERSRWAATAEGRVDPEEVTSRLRKFGEQIRAEKGRGFGILLDRTPSPTLERLLAELRTAAPELHVGYTDGAHEAGGMVGAALVGADGVSFGLGEAPELVACFDADPMCTEGDAVAFIANYAGARRAERGFRMYAAEPHLSLTGSNAEHRRASKSGEVAELLVAVAQRLRARGLDLPELPISKAVKDDPWVVHLANDLLDRPAGTTLVVVGERQSPQVHGLGLLVNAALGNLGRTLMPVERKRSTGSTLVETVEALQAGTLQTLFVLGANPVLDACGDLDVRSALKKADVVQLSSRRDETSRLAQLHIPQTHYLEAWGDLVARDGTVSVQQPLVAPLHASMSTVECLGHLLGSDASVHDHVRTTHGVGNSASEAAWQGWLHDGVVRAGQPAQLELSGRRLQAHWQPSVVEAGMEAVFVRDPSLLDGRFGNSPWLQELPDPLTHLTWGNAGVLAPRTAARLGVANGERIEVRHHGRRIRIPVWVLPGTAEDVVVLPLGYGRRGAGRHAGHGTSVQALRLTDAPWYLTGASVRRGRGSETMACTQVQTSQYGRPLHRQTNAADFADDPDFVASFEVLAEEHRATLLWEEPYDSSKEAYRWGMTIDLDACAGCGACTVACQAENNIPWVGKDEVVKGRELHWIRVDRYVEARGRGPLEVRHQPLNCQQCETAPCENVCPVAATVHSPEGMNDMVYNRCIGTRYCANNCPYKVRRFNFFHYAQRNDAEYGLGIAMQRNPNVTVRFRGVMEKCTYCTQRVARARIDAKVRGDRVIRDGDVVTACQQACPSAAIEFGNLNEASSRVAKRASDARNYALLAELNTRPRTTYLARITNPNPKMER